jgi:hypothetical protein
MVPAAYVRFGELASWLAEAGGRELIECYAKKIGEERSSFVAETGANGAACIENTAFLLCRLTSG